MKKLFAVLFVAVMLISVVPMASAATSANPWKDSSMHVMEIENYDSGYSAGDISKFPGFYSYNQAIKFAPAGGTIKNGQLVLNSSGTDSFFFKRAKGAVAGSLLSKAQGVGFYVKNSTKTSFGTAFYGIGDKDKMDKGAAMFFFDGADAKFIDMKGNATTVSGHDGLVTIPKGAEGYVLFDFADIKDGWHNNCKLDFTKTDLGSVGYRLQDANLSVRYTITFDHVFLYGKNLSNVPGTIQLKAASASAATTAKPQTGNTTAKVTSKATVAGESKVDESEATTQASETEATTLDTSTDETTAATESAVTTPDDSSTTKAATTVKNKKTSPLVPILIIAIIVVLAAGAIVVIRIVSKNKQNAADGTDSKK